MLSRVTRFSALLLYYLQRNIEIFLMKDGGGVCKPLLPPLKKGKNTKMFSYLYLYKEFLNGVVMRDWSMSLMKL